MHCKSEKRKIVLKLSTEAEVVALLDSCNQKLHVRKFLQAQGHQVGPLILYQDNLSCIALIARGRSVAEKTRHTDILYFWVKERVGSGEAGIVHQGTTSMYANVLTKSVRGAQFDTEGDAHRVVKKFCISKSEVSDNDRLRVISAN